MAHRMAVITFAHRGARLEAPENTIEAFGRALAAGTGALETDVWLSADREVVCTHDAVVRSGLRRHRVAGANASQLARFGVPRLADVYDALGTDFDLSVDVKEQQAGPLLLQVARDHGALERLWVCSPHVAELTPLRSETAVKLVHSTSRRRIEAALERHAHELAVAGVDAINLHHTEWSAGLVSLFHRFELRAFAWDTQEARHIRAVLRMGIDAVYSDRPDRMVGIVREWELEPSDREAPREPPAT
jgi:glycerophosphoryl diester phosphodiesterase